MSVESEKLERFHNIIFGEVDEQVAELQKCANEDKDAALERLNDEVLYHAYDSIKTEIKHIQNGFVKSASQYELEAKREVLRYREALAGQLFDRIFKRLEAYAKSADYSENMRLRLVKALEGREGANAIVYLKPEDMAFADTLKAATGASAQFKADPKIKIGGLIVYFPGETIAIDQTLDAALENERRRFVAAGELKIG